MSRFFRNFIFHSQVERGTHLVERASHQNNRGAGRCLLPWYFSLAGLCFMMAAFPGSPAWGFSLGTMQVKSHFGERFNARILVSGQALENLRVTIGSPQDYRKLGLERPQVLEQLYVKMLPDIEGSEPSILLLSDKPLFYPSFNLVVKAQSDSRTLYENYLISVDFRKSPSLKLKADRSENKKVKEEVGKEQ